MSIHRDRDRWRVKWREHGRQRSRTFSRKTDAQTFDREIQRRLQLGPHLARELDRNSTTLAQFVNTGFKSYATTLSLQTRKGYDWALRNHLKELAHEPLLALDVPRLALHQQFLLDHGRTANTVREAFICLSGILQIATEHGLVPGNAARGLRKVPLPAREEVRPLSPVELEQLIDSFDGRYRIVLLLCGHLGLRPMEARLATWDSFDGSNLTVGRARTKRSAGRTRVVSAPAVTAQELKRWRLESGGRGPEPIVTRMSKDSLHQWGSHHLTTKASELFERPATLYTLRHTAASLLHYCGWTVPEAAARMGHSVKVHWDTYAHVIEALAGKQHYPSLDALIESARGELEDHRRAI